MITVTARPRVPAALLAGLLAVSGLAACTVSLDATPDSSTAASAEPGKGSRPATSRASRPRKSSKPTKPAKTAGAKPSEPAKPVKGPTGSALAALEKVPVKGRAASTGYDRDEFGPAWKDTDRNGCDQRNDVLRRDLTDETLRPGTHGCVVLTGILADPYTGSTIAFTKKAAGKVQIDHVVALQNAWVTGAFGWSEDKRTELATDPLNLLAVDGPTNASKGAGDAATWLPRKSFRCTYVARQVAVKVKYGAWMTKAEHAAVQAVLATCPTQKLPQVAPVPLGEP